MWTIMKTSIWTGTNDPKYITETQIIHVNAIYMVELYRKIKLNWNLFIFAM